MRFCKIFMVRRSPHVSVIASRTLFAERDCLVSLAQALGSSNTARSWRKVGYYCHSYLCVMSRIFSYLLVSVDVLESALGQFTPEARSANVFCAQAVHILFSVDL